MKYHWLKQHGALHEGREAHFSEEDALRVLTPSPREARNSHAASAVHLAARQIPEYILKLVPQDVASSLLVIPVELRDDVVTIAAENPDDMALADRLRFLTAYDVRLVRADRPHLHVDVASWCSERCSTRCGNACPVSNPSFFRIGDCPVARPSVGFIRQGMSCKLLDMRPRTFGRISTQSSRKDRGE